MPSFTLRSTIIHFVSLAFVSFILSGYYYLLYTHKKMRKSFCRLAFIRTSFTQHLSESKNIDIFFNHFRSGVLFAMQWQINPWLRKELSVLCFYLQMSSLKQCLHRW